MHAYMRGVLSGTHFKFYSSPLRLLTYRLGCAFPLVIDILIRRSEAKNIYSGEQ